MSFRPGQSGAAFRKGKRWVGRFYQDVPGSTERKRLSVTLGSALSMTKSEARRKLRSMLEQMGLNDDRHLERINSVSRTFRQEAEWWRDNKLSLYKPSVQETMGSHLDKYILPRLGDMPLDRITDRTAQEMVAELSRVEYVVHNGKGTRKRLSPKSVRNVIGVLRLILGKRTRDWSIVLPEIPRQEQRYFTADEMQRIIAASKGQWCVLFATLASTGLRAGEAFGLHVEDLDLDAGTITVRPSVWNGQEVTPKTKSGHRVVNIDPTLLGLLREHLAGRRGGRVFETRNGTPLSKRNVRRKLHEILRVLQIPRGSLHAFRHGRVSILQSHGVPGDLVKEWIGHSNLQTTSRTEATLRKHRQQPPGDYSHCACSRLYSLPLDWVLSAMP